MKRWRGLKDLVEDAVVHGSAAIQTVHQAVARKPLLIIERVPSLAPPARTVRVVQDLFIEGTYGAVRLVTRAVGSAAGAIIDALEERSPPNRD
jgi:hypothetical protein